MRTKLLLLFLLVTPAFSQVGVMWQGRGIPVPLSGAGGSVAYTSISSVPTGTLLGRTTAGTGAAEAITAGAGIMTLLQTPTLANLGAVFNGTSGGLLCYTASGTLASSSALTANLPVIGGGSGACPSVGTRSGNTTSFATTTGSLTSGNIASWDGSGNLIAGGVPMKVGTTMSTTGCIPFEDGTSNQFKCHSGFTADIFGSVVTNGNYISPDIRISGNSGSSTPSSKLQWYAPGVAFYASVGAVTGTGSTSNPQFISFEGTTSNTGWRFRNTTASIGVNRIKIEEGAGQSTSEVFGVYANDGTTPRLSFTSTEFTLGTGVKLFLAQQTPSSASDTCTANQFAFDTGFVYVCTATNTWKRAAIATW